MPAAFRCVPLRRRVLLRAVPPRCCERVLRCARVMYTIVRMIVGARCWQRAGSRSLMLWIADNEQGVAVAVGVDCAARHGVARSACSVRHGAAVGLRLARASPR